MKRVKRIVNDHRSVTERLVKDMREGNSAYRAIRVCARYANFGQAVTILLVLALIIPFSSRSKAVITEKKKITSLLPLQMQCKKKEIFRSLSYEQKGLISRRQYFRDIFVINKRRKRIVTVNLCVLMSKAQIFRYNEISSMVTGIEDLRAIRKLESTSEYA